MAQRTTRDGSGSPADAPSRVEVTVVPGPRVRPARKGLGVVRDRFGARGLALMAIAGAVLAAAIAVATIGIGTSSHGTPRGPAARVAAGTTPTTRAVARNPFLPSYAVDATEIFHRVHGRWRLIRVLPGSKCQAVLLSGSRRSDLVICARTVSRLANIP